MRELTAEEIAEVSGGFNLVGLAAGGLTFGGALSTGVFVGDLVNRFNANVTKMSLGEAIYLTVHSS